MTAPPGRDEDVRARRALARAGEDRPEDAALTVVARRPGRTTLRAARGDRAWAVRLVPEGSPPLEPGAGARRIRREAVAAGIAPAVRFADEALGVAVEDWVAGGSWSLDAMRETARLERLGAVLAALHGLRADPAPFDLAARTQAYADRWRRARPGVDAARDRVLDRLARAAADLDAAPDPRPGHGDVTHGNVVGTDPVILVDWDYAATVDRSFDLATVVALHDVGDAGRDALLAGYERRAGVPVDRLRLSAAERLVRDLARAWAEAEVAERPDDSRARAWLRRLGPA